MQEGIFIILFVLMAARVYTYVKIYILNTCSLLYDDYILIRFFQKYKQKTSEFEFSSPKIKSLQEY